MLIGRRRCRRLGWQLAGAHSGALGGALGLLQLAGAGARGLGVCPTHHALQAAQVVGRVICMPEPLAAFGIPLCPQRDEDDGGGSGGQTKPSW